MNELVMLAVPGAGRDGLLRVVIVPRLGGPGTTLAAYPGLSDWPVLIATARFTVELGTDTATAAAPREVSVTSQADAAVWRACFDRISVRPYATPPPVTVPTPVPTAEHADEVVKVYTTAVASVGDPAQVGPALDAAALAGPPPAPDPGADVPQSVELDFHRALALLREHPAVLRRLGLIVDLDVSAQLTGDAGVVRVAWPDRPSIFDRVVNPWTAWERHGGRFLPASTARHDAGLLSLTPQDPARPQFPLVGFDVDAAVGALTETRQAAAQDARRRLDAARVDGPAPEIPLPTLRSAGLQLVHRARGDALVEVARRAGGNAARAAHETVLTADDLVLGYRVDVRYAGYSWFSLMRRHAEYAVDDTPVASLAEEGHVNPVGITRFATPGGGTASSADEVLVRWDGNRLGLPAPSPLAVDTARRTAPARAATPAADRLPYRLRTTFTADPDEPPGRPTLRFERSYSLRLRVCDLAGGGLATVDEDGDRGASVDVTYARHEAVQPPVLAPPAGLLSATSPPRVDETPLGPGGGLDRLVVRSDPAGSTPLRAYPDNATRSFTPPTATFPLAEWEGLLDGDDAAAVRLARRTLAPPRVSDVAIGGRFHTGVPDPGAEAVSVTVRPEAERVRGAGPVKRAWDAAAFPDHRAKRVTVSPGAPGSAVAVTFGGADETATVVLPPGVAARVEVSSAVGSSMLARFAVSGAAPQGTPAGTAIVAGRHPVVTPARTLQVVHAVRMPLAAPAGRPTAARHPGGTHALIADDAQPLWGVDRDSTAVIDVSAAWTDYVDAGTAVTAADVTAPGRASLIPLAVGLDDVAIGPIQHQFGDTRHRLVTYTLVAHSRFRDLFADDEDPAAFVRRSELTAVHVPSTMRPTPPRVASVTPSWTLTRTASDPPIEGDDPPDIEWRSVQRSGGRLRVELAAPWWSTGEGEQLGVLLRPDDPAAGTCLWRDPLVGGVGPVPPGIDTLEGAAGEPFETTDPTTGVTAVVVPFDVTLVGGRRVADIGFGAAAAAAGGMARLVLVRFQRHSLPGLEVSEPVVTDLVTLLPEREVRLERPTRLAVPPTVTVSGPLGGPVELRVESAPPGADPAGITSIHPDPTGWVVDARVEATTGDAVSVPWPVSGRAQRVVVREFADVQAGVLRTDADGLDADAARPLRFAAVLGW